MTLDAPDNLLLHKPVRGLAFFWEVFPISFGFSIAIVIVIAIAIAIGIENRIDTAFIDCCEAKLPGQRR
jgi:hypothetical protein